MKRSALEANFCARSCWPFSKCFWVVQECANAMQPKGDICKGGSDCKRRTISSYGNNCFTFLTEYQIFRLSWGWLMLFFERKLSNSEKFCCEKVTFLKIHLKIGLLCFIKKRASSNHSIRNYIHYINDEWRLMTLTYPFTGSRFDIQWVKAKQIQFVNIRRNER